MHLQRTRASLVSLFLLTFLIIANVCLTEANGFQDVRQGFPSYGSVVDQIDLGAIKSHLVNFTNMGSRFTGYPGYNAALDYIVNEFKKYGLAVSFHKYETAIPLDSGAEIKILSAPAEPAIKAYSLFPNQVTPVITPSGGLTGDLVYVGDGRLEDLKGKEIRGNIVLMNFNTQRRWVDVAKFGAKAVAFIEPTETTRTEADLKFLNIPFNFPRVYVSKGDCDKLLSLLGRGVVTVNVEAKSNWRKIVGRNVIGYLNGSDPRFQNQIFLISAYFDSFSVVPGVSPGATEACGISIMLDLVRYFKSNPPKYPVMFVAFSGRNQGLEGSRWFVEDYFFARFGRPDETQVGSKISMWIDLDITSGTNVPTICNAGGFYGTADYRPGLEWVAISTYAYSIVDEINSQLGLSIQCAREGITRTSGQMGSGYGDTLQRVFPLDNPFMSDAEPIMINRGPGLIITAAHDFRVHYRTPIDTYEKIDYNNLRTHAIFTYCVLHTFLQTDNFAQRYMSTLNFGRMHTKELMGLEGHYLKGQVAFYNETIAWYTPLPNAIVWLYLHHYTGGHFRIFQITNERGEFLIPHLYFIAAQMILNAFVLNDTTGNLMYGPDQGRFAYAPSAVRFEHDQEVGFYCVHKCGTLVLFDLIDPSWGGMPPESNAAINVFLKILRRDAHTEPFHFGYTYDPLSSHNRLEPLSGSYSAAALYLPENESVEVMLQSIYATRYPLCIMSNSTVNRPDGPGYRMRTGEQYLVEDPTLHYGENMYALQASRLKTVDAAGLTQNIADILETYRKTGELLSEARVALDQKDYALADFYAMKAWTMAREFYIGLRTRIEDSVYSILFFIVLSIPFIYLIEKLVFSYEGRKRVSIVVALYLLSVVLYTFIHPGVVLASDALMVILGSSVLILSIPILVVIFGMLSTTVRRFMVEIKGLHIAEIARSSAALIAFSTGIEHIKRRKIRFLLTITSIILMTTGFTLFCSNVPIVLFHPQPVQGKPLYEGVFLKRYNYGQTAFGVADEVVDMLKAKYADQAQVVPRAWRYTMVPGIAITAPYLVHKNYTYYPGIYALLGLTPQEEQISGAFAQYLISGRWFLESDRFVCILSNKTATRIGVTGPGEYVELEGIRLLVVGIIHAPTFDRISDLDNEGAITPIDLTAGPDIYNVHISADSCVILPYKTALSLGAKTFSVSMKFKNASKIPEMSREIYDAWPALDVFIGYQASVHLLTRRVTSTVLGWQLQVIPIVITAFAILNIMLGNVYERTREISTYSSVGLSPLHISLMFISESLIYALVGGLIGYLIALSSGKAMSGILMSQGVTINYASTWVVQAVSITMVITILSTIYPVRKSSAMVTPSLERAWKITTKPIGSQWNVPLPFVVVSDDEVEGFIAYLQEYIQPQMGERAKVFSVTRVHREAKEEEGRVVRSLVLEVKLEPYERGVSQRAQIVFMKDPKAQRWSSAIFLTRLTGSATTWISSNRTFIDNFRKQFLLWNAFPPSERRKYIERFREASGTR